MKLVRRRFLHLAGVGLTASTFSRTAWAQNYPTRPVKIIVPIGAAGSYDIVGRLLADQLTKRLGQSFLVENRPGAGAIIGTQAVVTAPPDGCRLAMSARRPGCRHEQTSALDPRESRIVVQAAKDPAPTP